MYKPLPHSANLKTTLLPKVTMIALSMAVSMVIRAPNRFATSLKASMVASDSLSKNTCIGKSLKNALF